MQDALAPVSFYVNCCITSVSMAPVLEQPAAQGDE